MKSGTMEFVYDDMMEYVRQNLPSGATIENIKKRGGRYLFDIVYDEKRAKATYSPALISPGHYSEAARMVIRTALTGIYLESGDIEAAKKWRDWE